MAFKILDTCILCGRCEKVCPENAISQGEDIYTIEKSKCNECYSLKDLGPQCASVCPMECCVPINVNKKINYFWL
ncbi:MAG: 4Fe-4S binding protein [Candidatus Kapaibacteriales bacterium]